jgi:hypothetical protein
MTTADIVGITLEQLQSRARGESERFAREVAVHAACALGISGRAVASALCLSQQRVSVLRRGSAPRRVRLLSDEVARRVRTDKWK